MLVICDFILAVALAEQQGHRAFRRRLRHIPVAREFPAVLFGTVRAKRDLVLIRIEEG